MLYSLKMLKNLVVFLKGLQAVIKTTSFDILMGSFTGILPHCTSPLLQSLLGAGLVYDLPTCFKFSL